MLVLLAELTTAPYPWITSPWDEAGRILLACLLGGLIGAERDRHGRSAGLRTQMLVCLGSCLVMLVSLEFAELFGRPGVPGAIQTDPARIAYGVMAGIGFLGGGVIIRDRGGIRGITTAASLWCTAAIGLASGMGMVALAVFSAGITLFGLLLLHRLGERITTHTVRTVHLVVREQSDAANIERFSRMLEVQGVRPTYTHYLRDKARGTESILFHIRGRDVEILDIVKTCSEDADVLKVLVR